MNRRELLNKYMAVVVVLGQSTHYLQAWKIFANKSAKDLSLSAYIIAAIFLSHWVIYAFFIKDKIIIFAEILALVGVLLILSGILIYN